MNKIKIKEFLKTKLWERTYLSALCLIGILFTILCNEFYINHDLLRQTPGAEERNNEIVYIIVSLFSLAWIVVFPTTFIERYKNLKSYVTLDRLQKLNKSVDYLRSGGLEEPCKITKTGADDFIEELTDLTYELVKLNKRREEIIQKIENYKIKE